MSIRLYQWSIDQREKEVITRYCTQCKRKVLFVDSMKRRHNANGKDIYQFAIYKCPNDHSWNKKLEIYKAKPVLPTEDMELEFGNEVAEYPIESVQELLQRGIQTIQISIQSVNQPMRLDLMLSTRMRDLSRTQIQKWIKQGRVQVNSQIVSPKYLVREQDQIYFQL